MCADELLLIGTPPPQAVSRLVKVKKIIYTQLDTVLWQINFTYIARKRGGESS